MTWLRRGILALGIICGVWTGVSGKAADAPEIRALWVTRATLTSPDAIAQMIRAARAGGFNTLIVQVRGRGDAYYASTIEPRAVDLAARPAQRAAAPFRSRQPVHERGVPAADGRARVDVQPLPLGQRLGQRGDGKLLLLPQGRACGPQDLSHARPGQSRRVRLHREVL